MSGAALNRPMTAAELAIVLDWARAEGWNPGLGDAEAFHAADPDGFMVAELDGVPIASISIVRFGGRHAFLGLFICRPERRGQGHGFALWRAAMDRLAPATTGLDGVVAQQANYARSGFARSHRTVRHAGVVAGEAGGGGSVPAGPEHRDAILALDRAVTGFDRSAFLTRWLAAEGTRRSRVTLADGALAGFGTVRTCVEGCKIGPLVARDAATAERLALDLAAEAGGGPVMLDVPEPNAPGMALARALGLEPVFETARMWRGPAPAQDLGRTFGVATLELG